MSIGSVSTVPYVPPLPPAKTDQPAAAVTISAAATSPGLVNTPALSPMTVAALISQQGASDPGISSAAGAAPDRKIQKMQNALQALQTLKERPASASDNSKGLAMRKLATLKAKLKALMMLGGDPRQRARAAAAIAKEIAAAAKEYAQAGGDPGASVAPDASAVQSAAAPTVDPRSGDPDVVTVTASDQTAESSRVATVNSSDAAAPGTPTTGLGDGMSTANPCETGSNRNPAEKPAGVADSVATPRAKSGSSEMDEAFVKEVRRLADQAKGIIKSAEQSMRLKHETPDSTSEAAFAEVEAATRQIGAGSTIGYEGSISEPPALAMSIPA